MNYALESFTGIRPTADLTVANFLGAVQPILEQEAAGMETAIFLAELHATTTNRPSEVMEHSKELGRTLIASGIRGNIYSQRQVSDLVFEATSCLQGLTSVTRLLRLPTLKEKVMQSDNPAAANVALATYPLLMAGDIVLARPREVPTGKDQKAHLEITNELIRSFNREYDAKLPEPCMREVQLPNILSLDGSGRKMSKSYPKGAIFLSDTPDTGHRKIMKAVTAPAPGEAMDAAIDNMTIIGEGLNGADSARIDELHKLGEGVKEGRPQTKQFKELLGEITREFLEDTQDRRASVSDQRIQARIDDGSKWFRDTIGEETVRYVRNAYWSN